MKFITDIKDDVEFLSKLYDSAEIVNVCMAETGILNIRKRMPSNLPKIGSKDSESVKAEKIRVQKEMLTAQALQNIMDMARKLMKEQPEHAIALMKSLIVLDEGEDYPHGMDLFSTGIKALTQPQVLDFFTTLNLLGIGTSADSAQK